MTTNATAAAATGVAGDTTTSAATDPPTGSAASPPALGLDAATQARVDRAVAAVRAAVPDAAPRVAVVLGSGWGPTAARVEGARRIAYADIPGWPVSQVGGHAGELLLGRLGGRPVALLSGRSHQYENERADNMALPLWTLAALGCRVLVQTNAAGSLDPALPPGSLMLVDDHINFAQRSPLAGKALADRFVGMVDAYDPALRQRARAACAALRPPLACALGEGVYVWFLGPQFETPAEIRMFRLLGARAVGMSTVAETILARHAGLRVLALSLITNLAAGMSGEALSHAHTLAQAGAAGDEPARALAAIVAAVDA